AVAYTDEGVSLRKAGITMPVMVMSPDIDSFDRMIAWKLEPELYNHTSIEAFLKIAETLQVENYPVHIKLDTGMHRLGFEEHQIGDLIHVIQASKRIKIKSVFSHLAASEDESLDGFTQEQATNFIKMTNAFA